MIIGRAARVVVLGSFAVLVLVGCSSNEDSAACEEILGVLTDGSETISSAAADPATAGEAIREVAGNLRSAADGASEDIGSSADDLAALYEDMADGFENGTEPDMSGLESAATALQEACS